MRKTILIALLLLLAFMLSAKEWNQYYFRFELVDKTLLPEISKIISVDNIRGNWVYAYANDEEYSSFMELGLKTQLLPSPASLTEPIMSSDVREVKLWDSYPTYDSYISTMNSFASNYPNLCQIVNVGTTVNGRSILFARISDNVSAQEAEPEVMYTSTIHGDETTGFVLMLRLIDTLLSSYGTNQRLTGLVNNLEIWICPNTNPDGTYYGGNNTVSGARRYNYNGYDLNRNFPDPNGNQYSGQPLQQETTLMMNLANNHHFVYSVNFHGGAEVVNYPWDYTYTAHPDENWYISTSFVYANNAIANGPSGYFTSVSSNGITNGADWYVITGGRQDWMNYSAHCREVTIEISNTKMPASATLPNYWNYNYEAMISYLEQANYGIHGIVQDPYGNPLSATITVNNYDNSYSTVITDPTQGDFYRYLSPGTYSLTISASGYPDKTINGIVVNANTATQLSVIMGELPHYQQISLAPGWNLLSFNVDLGTHNFSSVFGSNLLQIKDTAKSYAPAMPTYFNTLSSLQSAFGYWVNNSSAQNLSIQGQLLNTANYPVALNTGWNLVPYLPDNSLPVASAIASILSKTQEVRYLSSVWNPSTGGTLSVLEPGKAYWIKVSEPCQLLYP
ncbi:MAG TPA: M14 family zinc carboxypeptidase [Candidatus Cloacimonas sp.]|nr:M14 family zinc carboxypeptidase [Candidatus Cloacimonas sp.]